MSLLERREGYAVTAGLVGVTLIPLTIILVLNFRTVTRHSQPIKFANIYFRIALLVYIINVILYTAYASVAAAGTVRSDSLNYLVIMADLFLGSGVILFGAAIYFAGLAALYTALGKQKWWSWLRLDTFLGTGLLFIFLIAYWGVKLSDTINYGGLRTSRWRLTWLLIIIDLTLSLMALAVVGIACYALPKLNKKKAQLPIGKVPVLLVVASLLWALTCVYGFATTVKTHNGDWEYDELVATRVIYPLFGPWVVTAAFALLGMILQSPLWSDPAAIPESGTHAPSAQPYQPPLSYPQMVYQQPYPAGYPPQPFPTGGQHPQPQPYPNGFQQNPQQQNPQQQYPQQQYPQQQYPQQQYPQQQYSQGYQQPQQYPQGYPQPQQPYTQGYQQPQQQQSAAGGYQQQQPPQQQHGSPVAKETPTVPHSPPHSPPVYAHEVDANQNPHVTVVK